MSMTPPDIAALREVLGRATTGPWRGVSSDDYQIEASAYPRSYTHRFKDDDTGSALAVFGNRPADFGEANRDLVVTAVNALPSLLDEVERLTAERDEIQSDWKAADAEVARLRAELAAAREAFKAIADEAKRENGSWVHLKRCIAVQAIKALKTSDVDEVGR